MTGTHNFLEHKNTNIKKIQSLVHKVNLEVDL